MNDQKDNNVVENQLNQPVEDNLSANIKQIIDENKDSGERKTIIPWGRIIDITALMIAIIALVVTTLLTLEGLSKTDEGLDIAKKSFRTSMESYSSSIQSGRQTTKDFEKIKNDFDVIKEAFVKSNKTLSASDSKLAEQLIKLEATKTELVEIKSARTKEIQDSRDLKENMTILCILKSEGESFKLLHIKDNHISVKGEDVKKNEFSCDLSFDLIDGAELKKLISDIAIRKAAIENSESSQYKKENEKADKIIDEREKNRAKLEINKTIKKNRVPLIDPYVFVEYSKNAPKKIKISFRAGS